MDNIIKGAFGGLFGIAIYFTFAIVMQVVGIVDFNNELQTVSISNWLFVGLVVMCFLLFSFNFYFLYKWYKEIVQ